MLLRIFIGINLFLCSVFANSWKENSLVLQNPDSLFWNDRQFDILPFDSTFFIPPSEFWEKWYYPSKNYLQPPSIPLLPQFSPYPWKIPSILPELSKIENSIFEKDYVISYQFLMKNEIPQGEKYNISEPISRIDKNKVINYSCQIDVNLEDDIEIPDVLDILLSYLLQNYKDDVLECLYKSGVQLREDSVGGKYFIKNKTLFALPPTWVRVSLQNGYLIVKVFKEKE